VSAVRDAVRWQADPSKPHSKLASQGALKPNLRRHLHDQESRAFSLARAGITNRCGGGAATTAATAAAGATATAIAAAAVATIAANGSCSDVQRYVAGSVVAQYFGLGSPTYRDAHWAGAGRSEALGRCAEYHIRKHQRRNISTAVPGRKTRLSSHPISDNPDESIIGPRNLSRESENPDVIASPSTDHGMVGDLRSSFADSHMQLA
jgi:hypothetical protein